MLKQHVDNHEHDADKDPDDVDLNQMLASAFEQSAAEAEEKHLEEALGDAIASTKKLLQHAQDKVLRLNSSHFTGTLDYSYLMLQRTLWLTAIMIPRTLRPNLMGLAIFNQGVHIPSECLRVGGRRRGLGRG